MLDDVEIDDLEGADGFPGACEEYFLGKILAVLRDVTQQFFCIPLKNYSFEIICSWHYMMNCVK